MTTLSAWRSDRAIGLLQVLPLQTYEDALALVDAYLSSTGGWTPDVVTDQTGEGVPTSGATDAEAVEAIRSEQVGRVYRNDASFNMTIALTYYANLAPDQSDADVLAQMQPLIEDFITQQLSKAAINGITFNTLTGTISAGGTTSAADRVTIQAGITSGIDNDPRMIGLSAARALYGLGLEWNVETIYTEPDTTLVVVVKKYSDTTTYVTLDSTSLDQYVIGVNRDTYGIETGARVPIEPT